MKKIFCFSLALLILTISILVYCPLGVFASYPDDYFSLSKPYTDSMGLSSSDAQAAVNAHKDIADSNGILCFQYTPTDTYNWTMNTKKQKIHLSDNQLKNLLMSKHSLSHGFLEFIYGASNSNAYRGFISSVGVATKTDSDTLLGISDKITGNYNYLNAIDYNEETQTITMSNDNSSVDKLREEIKNYWYKEKGLLTGAAGSYHCSTKSYFLNNILKNGWFDYEEDYNEYFNNIKNTDYSFVFTDDNNSAYVTYLLNKSDISYFYLNHEFSDYYSLNFANSVGYNVGFTNITNRLNLRDFYSSITSRDYSDCDTSVFSSIKFYLEYYNSVYSFKQSYSSRFLKKDGSEYDVLSSNGTYYFVCDELPLIFKNEASMKSFIEGSDSFLASTINKTGEDITFSIDKMNENIGEKLDSLIDSINSGKSNMSADELQNAIDKGLEDLNKNTEDIKDNTQEMNSKLDSILEALNAQNQTLLAILGVTKKIADTVDDIDEKTDYNSIISTISTIFNAVQCALLYGQNTLKDSDSSAQAQAVSYSDDIAVYSDSGGTYKPNVLNMDLRSGIFGHFPFSMIYHMYDWCAAFVAEAKAPVFTYNYGFLVGDKDNPELTVSIDLSQYEDWRDVAASFMRLAFTLAVAFGSYKRFKEEML